MIRPSRGYWKTGEPGMALLSKARRLQLVGNTLAYVRFIDDFRVFPVNNVWTDTGASGFGDEKLYVVQTIPKIIER
jgi:adenine-specific DNA-methyltransferase